MIFAMPSFQKVKSSILFHSVFQVMSVVLLFHWWKKIPPPSEAVLVIGVIAIIMTICDMKIWSKALWLVLVFAFAVLETKSIAKDRAESSEREKDLYNLAKGTADKTDRTLNSVGVLGIQLSSLPGQIQDAKKHNDLELAAQLEKQQEEIQKRSILHSEARF